MRLSSSTQGARCMNAPEIEVRAELVVQALEQVQVELRGDAGRIVVGGFKHAR